MAQDAAPGEARPIGPRQGKSRVKQGGETGADAGPAGTESGTPGRTSDDVTIEMEKAHPFVINGVEAKRITIEPVGFIAYAEATAVANTRSPGPEQYRKYLFRARLARQAKVWDGKGGLLKPGESDWLGLPRAYLAGITAALDIETGQKGSIVVTGDGVTSPVVYRLGTPLALGGSGEGERIEELEFMARTLGDIEDVLAEETRVTRAAALISKCAKPISTGATPMQGLPAWAAAQITLRDGVAVMEEVLPSFL